MEPIYLLNEMYGSLELYKDKIIIKRKKSFLIHGLKGDKTIFKYLDIQDFIQIKKNDIIYFVNSKNNSSAQISYNKNNGQCHIHYTLIDEISKFFSLHYSDCEKVIGKWVENTLQIKVANTFERNF